MIVHWKKIFLILIPIVLSYFLVSTLLSGAAFYWFDLVWRVAIICSLIFGAKIRPNFSRVQWLALVGFLVIEVILYHFLASGISPVRIAISILFAPLEEELLFRGWIMNQIQGTKKQQIIISSCFFSLYHLKNAYVLTLPALLYQLFFAGVVAGPILGWVRLKYNSLFPSLLLHSAAFNTIADTLTPKILPMIVRRNRNFLT